MYIHVYSGAPIHRCIQVHVCTYIQVYPGVRVYIHTLGAQKTDLGVIPQDDPPWIFKFINYSYYVCACWGSQRKALWNWCLPFTAKYFWIRLRVLKLGGMSFYPLSRLAGIPCFAVRGLSLGPRGSLIRLGQWLASSQGTICLCFTSARITSVGSPQPAFYLGAGCSCLCGKHFTYWAISLFHIFRQPVGQIWEHKDHYKISGWMQMKAYQSLWMQQR